MNATWSALAQRTGVGVLLALASVVVGRVRESWEYSGRGLDAIDWQGLGVAMIAGALAGMAFHLARGRGSPSAARHYTAWILAATVAAVPILLSDARASGPWILIVGAPLFGVLAGGGWAIFLRRLDV